jgi:GDP-L-fucose synthase
MASFWGGKRVLVTGASGFLGRHLVPLLQKEQGELFTPTHKEYDLVEQVNVRRLFADFRPQIVFHFAALVGGILADKRRPADFFYQNLLMNAMVFHEAYLSGVEKYITCMCGCSYPKDALSPIGEDTLFQGYPQPESAPYALAKSMNVVQSEAYRRQYGLNSIVLVPGNMYGPYDNFSLEDSHVIPGLIRKVFEAKRNNDSQITVWGSGKPTRDFVYVGDVAQALIYAAETYNSSEIINISSGTETSIKELVDIIVRLMDYQGQVVWDSSKPDGQLCKIFAVDRMQSILNFTCKTSLEEGLRETIHWFEANYPSARL